MFFGSTQTLVRRVQPIYSHVLALGGAFFFCLQNTQSVVCVTLL